MSSTGILSIGGLAVKNSANHDIYNRQKSAVCKPLYSLNYSKAHVYNGFAKYMDMRLVGSGLSDTHTNGYEYNVVSQANDKVCHQSKVYMPLQLTQVVTCYLSCTLEVSGGKPNVLSRVGMYDDLSDISTGEQRGEGYYFELDGTTLYAVKRETINDTHINTREVIDISSLEFTIDYASVNIYVIELCALQGIDVRFGIVNEGITHYIHTMNNTLTCTALPVRTEILSTNTVSGGAEQRMYAINLYKYGDDAYGLRNILNIEKIRIRRNDKETLITFRLLPQYNRLSTVIKELNIFTLEVGDTLQWMFVKNPTFSNSITYTPLPNSIIEYSYDQVNIANDGDVLAYGYTNAVQNGTILYDDIKHNGIGRSIEGTSDVYCIVANNISNSNIYINCMLAFEDAV